jgi:hypothetical protein
MALVFSLGSCGDSEPVAAPRDLLDRIQFAQSPGRRGYALFELEGQLFGEELIPRDYPSWGPGRMTPVLEDIADVLIPIACCETDPDLRAQARSMLANIRPRRAAAVFVAAALLEHDIASRAAAIFALDRYGEVELLRPLIPIWDEWAGDPNDEQTTATDRNLARALARMAPDSEDFVRDLANSPVPRVRYHALWILCATGRARPDEVVRAAAASPFLRQHCNSRFLRDEIPSSYQDELVAMPPGLIVD